MAASLIGDETSVPRIVDGGVAHGAGGIFLLGAFAEVAAGEVVREHEVLNLSVKDSAAFAKAMLAPPKPNRKLTRAFARHRQSVTVK